MAEVKNACVWYDPNTGRLQVTVQGKPGDPTGDINLKSVGLRFEYGHGSYTETSIKAYPRRRNSND